MAPDGYGQAGGAPAWPGPTWPGLAWDLLVPTHTPGQENSTPANPKPWTPNQGLSPEPPATRPSPTTALARASWRLYMAVNNLNPCIQGPCSGPEP